jgi:hypothetical protein
MSAQTLQMISKTSQERRLLRQIQSSSYTLNPNPQVLDQSESITTLRTRIIGYSFTKMILVWHFQVLITVNCRLCKVRAENLKERF